jgi:hypothetical protein
MATEYEDDNYENEDESKPKGLRAQLETSLAEKKQLKEELEALRGEVRKSTIASLLAAKGINSKVMKFIDDSVTDEETLNAWIDDNADLFGLDVNNNTEDAKPNATPDEIQSARRLANLNEVANTPSKMAELENKMANASSKEELADLIKEAGKYML